MANCNLCNVYLPDGEEHATLRKTFPDNSDSYNPICPSCVAKHIASYRRQADYFIFFGVLVLALVVYGLCLITSYFDKVK